MQNLVFLTFFQSYGENLSEGEGRFDHPRIVNERLTVLVAVL